MGIQPSNIVIQPSNIRNWQDVNVDILGYTLWLFNIAMENCPFIDDVPMKTSIYKGFSMAMLNNQMVKGSLGGETSVLRTFRMSGKELVKERVSEGKS